MKKKNQYTENNSKFRQAQQWASQILQDPEKLKTLVAEAAKKLQILKSDNPTGKALKEKVSATQRMVQAYMRGDYRVIPWKSIMLLVAGILYFVMPFDLVPDFIPLAGYLDDLSIMLWIFQAIKTDIEDFETWEKGFSKQPTKN